jgi:hypothetical protein
MYRSVEGAPPSQKPVPKWVGNVSGNGDIRQWRRIAPRASCSTSCAGYRTPSRAWVVDGPTGVPPANLDSRGGAPENPASPKPGPFAPVAR